MMRQAKGDAGSPFLRQVDLFRAGEGGYHTYRIPSLIVAPDGSILAICEGRRNTGSDFDDIDLMLRRSHDDGATWTDAQVIAADGEDTIGNACPVVDSHTGTIWLPHTKNNQQVFVMSSADNGLTWSERVEITRDVTLSCWLPYLISAGGVERDLFCGASPGHGIQLRSGRLIIPCWHNDGKPQYSYLFYSDDHGRSWKLGPTIGRDVDECELVQTHDGPLYMNMRSRRTAHRRAYAWSSDDGDSWSEVQVDDSLIDADCQGSVERFTDLDGYEKNRVIFVNAASTKRERLTIRVSYDECRTWATSRVLNAGPSAYSDLCVAPDMSICCFYERGEEHAYEKLTFARFNIEWLTDGADALRARDRP